MAVGSALSLTLPVVSTTTGPAWATTLNTILQALIDACEAKVPSGGLGIDANVEFNNYSATEVATVTFQNGTSAVTGNAKLYFRDGELYANDNSGNQIKLTSGGLLNAAAIGGFSGQFVGSTASATFTIATGVFAFLENTGLYAKLASGGVTFRRYGEASPLAITMQAPAALAGAYSITLPAAVPAATELVSMTAGGVLTADGKHTTRTLLLGNGNAIFSLPTDWGFTTGAVATIAANSTIARYTIPLVVGDRINSVTFHCTDIAASACVFTGRLHKYNVTTATESNQSAAVASAGDGTLQNVALTGITPAAIAANEVWFVQVSVAWSSGLGILRGCTITYDRP